jgi:hypothetical protein
VGQWRSVAALAPTGLAIHEPQSGPEGGGGLLELSFAYARRSVLMSRTGVSYPMRMAVMAAVRSPKLAPISQYGAGGGGGVA